MYLLYIDESGDSGLVNSPTDYYILSAVVVHELRWKPLLEDLVVFRKKIRDQKGLKLREEIHSNEMINRPGDLKRIKRNDRLDILKQCLDFLNNQSGIGIFSVYVNKTQRNKDDIFEYAWSVLLTRVQNTIAHRNFPGPVNADERAIIISDNTNGESLTKLVRKMRHFNPVPDRKDMPFDSYRNVKLDFIVEDPVYRDSQNSLLIQMVDVVAYFCAQMYSPNSYVRGKGAKNFYKRLSDVLVKQVSKEKTGVVRV